jgi:hypothetical protein
MGHHYVPRQHLRRFKIEGQKDLIWMYDKQTRKFCQAGIASVAQEPGFYDLDVEQALAAEVEGPGKIAIDKLLERQTIDHSSRLQLSFYFLTMLTRGPRRRKKSLEEFPETREDVLKEAEDYIRDWIQREPDNPLAYTRLKELEAARVKFTAEIPQNIIDQIRTPFWSENMLHAIYNMYWHIIPASDGVFYVTSDTPAHFFESYGLGTTDSEFTFTLSHKFALIGENKRHLGICYEKPQVQIGKEINRRILSHADRFAFSPRKESWIETVSQKRDPFLNRIHWV